MKTRDLIIQLAKWATALVVISPVITIAISAILIQVLNPIIRASVIVDLPIYYLPYLLWVLGPFNPHFFEMNIWLGLMIGIASAMGYALTSFLDSGCSFKRLSTDIAKVGILVHILDPKQFK